MYRALFSLLKRAFVLLGMVEFFGQEISFNACVESRLSKHPVMLLKA
jgi:hypothetical protein